MSHHAPSAAILAGGQATRFGGRDKSALPVDGRPILDRQMAALSPLTDDVMIVAGREPRVAPSRSGGAPARVIHDIVPGCGPLGGLHAALTAARHDPLLLIACDMPYVSSPFLAYLLSLAGSVDIVVPHSGRGYHPLCAVYARACLAPVAARLGEGRLRMRELLDDMRTRVVTVEDMEPFGDPTRLLANVNTPAEWADLETLQGHKP
jgi:molybdopterin-guanine dinucleotide biosynthesis protein A